MNKVGTAYILWLGCLLQLHGLHRLYNGKFFTGFLWLSTFGLFGIGQIIDLLLIPNMVDAHNVKLKSRYQPALTGSEPAIHRVIDQPNAQLAPPTASALQQQTIALLKAAEARGGRLSVTQGVIATGLGFAEVESQLQAMLKTGYVDVGNDPETGVVLYEFKEM
jgi:TM2 domain-containing membrane protein YozV